MNYSLVELEPNEKIHLEINEKITLFELAHKLKDYIQTIHIYMENEYKKVYIFKDGSVDCPDFPIKKATKIILENTEENCRFLLDLDCNILGLVKGSKKIEEQYDVKEISNNDIFNEMKIEKKQEELVNTISQSVMNEVQENTKKLVEQVEKVPKLKEVSESNVTEKSQKKVVTKEENNQKINYEDHELFDSFINPKVKATELSHWSAESIKTINIPYERQASLDIRFKETGFYEAETSSDKFLSLIEECSSTSTAGNISFRFYFMEGRNFLKVFHYQMFLILKRFMEKLIKGHKQFKESHYFLDVFVFVSMMKSEQLGSAMIHKYVKNDENNLILPTKAIMKINHKFLSKTVNEKVNIKLMQTLFHEMIHCLGFGYWDLFGKNLCQQKFFSQSNEGIISSQNILTIDKTTSYLRSLIRDTNMIGVAMTNDRTHFSMFNAPIVKDKKLFGVVPGLKYELMSNNHTHINVFTKISASVLDTLGYDINYSMCDEYPFTPLPEKMQVEYSKITSNHFASGFEKYILLLKANSVLLSGIETFTMKENKEYKIKNNHSFSLYVVSALEEDEKYLLGEKEGVSYLDNMLIINPNGKTPSYFYIVSSITFGGIPIVKLPCINSVNFDNCFNHISLNRLIEEFMSGKSPRWD